MTQAKDVDTIWNKCSDYGKKKPWFVISVIGDSSSMVPTTWEKSAFQTSLIETAKGAKECWIIYHGGKGKLSETIRKAVRNHRITAYKHKQTKQRGGLIDLFRKAQTANIKLIGVNPGEKEMFVEGQLQDGLDETFTVSSEDYTTIYTGLLKRIGKERVKVMTLQKDLTVRIPVTVLVAEGDLKTIKHVESILKEGIPVVLLKGSGKAADVISEFLSNGKKSLKTRAPLLLGTFIKREDFTGLKDVLKGIKKRKHLISIHDVKDSKHSSLSDTVTSAILLAWSVEGAVENKKQTETQSMEDIDALKRSFTGNAYKLFPLPNLDQIASFEDTKKTVYSETENMEPPQPIINSINDPPEVIISNVDEQSYTQSLNDATLRPRFQSSINDNSITTLSISRDYPRPVSAMIVSSSLAGSTTLRPARTWSNPSAFPLYFFIAYQLIQLNFKNDKQLYKENFTFLLEKAIEANKLDYVTVLLHEHDVEFDKSSFPHLYLETVKCKLCFDEDAVDCQHFYSVLKTDKTTKKLFHDYSDCIEAGRRLCRNFLHYPRNNSTSEKKQTVFHDLLIWSIFAHRPQLATLFWNACEDQLLTSLLATGVLKRMAIIAKEIADQSVYQDLLEHSRVFEKRSLEMQSHLYRDYPSEAMELMTTEFSVWDITISPLRCAYDIGFNEFIAHPCSQRCLNKIWYNKLGTNFKASIKKGFKCQKVGNKWSFCRLLAAPFTKFVVHYIIFVVALVLYSYFLLTNLGDVDQIGGFEVFVYVWMVADMIEEYVVPKFQRRKNSTSQTSDLWYGFRRYIDDFWNVLDTISYVTTTAAIVLRFTNGTLLWARRLYTFSLFFMYMRFLHVVLLYKKVGVYVILIKEMMRDLARFVVILLVFMVAAGVMYHMNMYPNHPDMWSNRGVEHWRIWDIIKLPYWQIYGEIFLDTLFGTDQNEFNVNANFTTGSNDTCTVNWACSSEECKASDNVERCVEPDWILNVIAAAYMLLSNLLLVNLVIALFSARFEKVKVNSEKIWRYIRYSYVMDYRIRLPAVLNLILRPVMIILWIFEKCRCSSSKVHAENITKQEQEDGLNPLEHIRTLQSMCAAKCS